MAKTIELSIGGRNYSLKGENEDTIRRSADLVNNELKQLGENYGRSSVETLSILAALNIAEKHNVLISNTQQNIDFVISELSKMAEYIDKNISGEN